MISRHEILRGETCPATLEPNLAKLLEALNAFRKLYGRPMFVTSGYRTAKHNAEVDGAKNSAHLYCMAADFEDFSGDLKRFIKADVEKSPTKESEVLKSCGLWMEEPSATPTWIHLQIRPAKKRIFKP